MNKKTVALIFGGTGCERDISVLSAKNLYPYFDKGKFRVLPVFIDESGAWLTDADYSSPALDGFISSAKAGKAAYTHPVRLGIKRGFITECGIIECHSAFPMLHGDGGEDGAVQGALRTAGIATVGCDTLSSAVCLDKGFTKAVAESMNIPVVPWIYITEGDEESFICEAERAIGYPLFIKPSRLGSSVGAGIAKNRYELRRAFRAAREAGGERILAERFIENAREIECGFYSARGKLLFTDPGEISSSFGFYDYSSKYTAETHATVSDISKIDSSTSEKIKEYARALVLRLGCMGMSRIDFFLDGCGNIYFNEINTIPGMTEGSLYPRLLARCGISTERMLTELIEDTLYAGNIR